MKPGSDLAAAAEALTEAELAEAELGEALEMAMFDWAAVICRAVLLEAAMIGAEELALLATGMVEVAASGVVEEEGVLAMEGTAEDGTTTLGVVTT